jgi:hypothetical protein
MVTQLAREFGAYVIGTGRAADRHKAHDFGVPYRQAARQRSSCLDDVGRWGAGEAEPMLQTGPACSAAALPDPRMHGQGCFSGSSVGAWALLPSHDQCGAPS